ncbi:MAG: YdiU family protein [Marinobacter sp.]|nr:YdiU family protein [Marinobacter sp.]
MFKHIDNSYARLPEAFFRACEPTPVAEPQWLAFNEALAEELGMLPGTGADALQVFAGNQVPDWATPVATAYAGHQFGHFVPQLGDGRAVLLAEVLDTQGQRRDVQLKGAGRTPFSRSGDGRSPIGPVIREYLVSEAMHALGVPTTRALAAVVSGEPVYREYPLPGAVLTRVASSHIRVGTFQYFAARGDTDSLRELVDYTIDRHYPEARDTDNPVLSLLEQVALRQASLVARWMGLGFIHGVMNTDNTAITGETIDYGPCAFMEGFQPDKVYSSIDSHGRYAYDNQPKLIRWNLARFAETLLPLLSADSQQAVAMATDIIDAFPGAYQQAWLSVMTAKLGLGEVYPDDEVLINDFLALLAQERIDFTEAFRRLVYALADTESPAGPVTLFRHTGGWQAWAQRWLQRLEPVKTGARERLLATNPQVIPRNHRIEQAITQASETGQLDDFQRLQRILRQPFDVTPEDLQWLAPAQPHEQVVRTFCGT